jgi:hypothetical protein
MHNKADDIARPGSRRHEIALLAVDGLTRAGAYGELRPMVLSQTEPFVFTYNPGNGQKRRPHSSMSRQLTELRHEINRTFRLLELWDDSYIPEDDAGDEEIPTEVPTEDETPDEETPEDETPEPDKPEASGKKRKRSEMEWFLRRVREVRAWCEQKEREGSAVDSIGMRPIVEGKKAIEAGIPAKAMLYAMAQTWPADTREMAGIEDFDFESISTPPETLESEFPGSHFHKMAGYAIRLARARVPVFLVGPSGSGKSHLAEQIATVLGLPYAYTPMTGGATPSWLLGSWSLSQERPFITRQFLELYANGGVFNFEEMDAADENMLIVVNNALASGHFDNPVNGERYDKSPDYIPVATGNTPATGATREYTGRNRLDFATRDRFRMGLIQVGFDERLEAKIAGQ